MNIQKGLDDFLETRKDDRIDWLQLQLRMTLLTAGFLAGAEYAIKQFIEEKRLVQEDSNK